MSILKKKQSMISYLSSIDLKSPIEQQLLQNAINKLEKKQDETRVANELGSALTRLALKQEISQQGLDLLTQLQKPNFASDFGRSVNLWF
ncbi:hypothetical protein [Leuconostoc pseudomesenteroides]|uniref:hypothetical protein n=1 Tax=Leuconostoc pseudomesenteroides TaxID=33968 RepID=UPI0032DFE810